MSYKEYKPSSFLKAYVACFFTCKTDTELISEDKVFACGSVEVLFNLGIGKPQKIVNGKLSREPFVQLWGQTIQPFSFASIGKHDMLGIRFLPHAAACFFEEPIAIFNDQMVDFNDVTGPEGALLYDQLLSANSLNERINLIENFLINRLLRFEHKFGKAGLVKQIVLELQNDDFFKKINTIARQYGISSRYLQTLFSTYSGLSPSLFSKISRFQKSLNLIVQNEYSLTSIAINCGYYDQSHFIKDFKAFTGITPSHFSPESSTDFLVPLLY